MSNSKKQYEFGGYATRNDLVCADGRVIRHGAFSECDGVTVPLVWQHRHDALDNVLGHALLEERPDGVYAYCTTNDTPQGRMAKSIVEHGDISSLSIFANHLKQNGSEVVHGIIREVSLVLAGANPGAFIDNMQFAHSDGSVDLVDDEAVVYTGTPVERASFVQHEDPDPDEDDQAEEVEEKEEKEDKEEEEDEVKDEEAIEHADGRTPLEAFNSIPEEKQQAVFSIIAAAMGEGEPTPDAQQVLDSLEEDQRNALYQLVGSLVEDEEAEDVQHDDLEGETMKFNAFESGNNDVTVLTHDDMKAIIDDAQKSGNGSLKDAVLAHGITSIEVLFPEAQTISNQPDLITREMEWVQAVLGSVRKTPFARVKSITANLTADDARARGYIKGTQKLEEQIEALKRTTDPQTVYKLQKLDRDDVVDITDFDVIAFMRQEMRVMLNEELARAILVGDGRSAASQDKISETHIRPVWTDVETYTIHTTVDNSLTGAAKAKAFIEACVRSRKLYKGSGTPALYIGQDLLTELRLLRDGDGYRLYKNDQELADELRVSKIVEVEIFDGLSRTVGANTHALGGIIVNLIDYNVGANKGGEVTMFDDFDLNFNKYEYLIETRCSGALIRPMSAIAIEFAPTGSGVRYVQVHPAASDNPASEGWYILDGDDGYKLATETSPVAGRSYYDAVTV